MKSSIISEEINLFLRHSDEFTTNDVDLNNHFDIFFAIYSQVKQKQNKKINLINEIETTYQIGFRNSTRDHISLPIEASTTH